ncbi:GAF domain-containing protein [Methylomonas sp. SURF-2]|uniref:GAF domain-containing protein n=1 Tax=Methylomonas subterranea TaxID=2952225 RepID=A0ABT1TE89_9GAMM|nr:GAF domain-containing protein [Methylomonas sp. SURF-2]MCQ8103412.1 GAF domain-containing protein [Methylomonas sp. SURF-2]
MAANKMAPEQLYISPLEFNDPFGDEDSPLQPVLRIAAPVFDGAGARRGVLVCDYAAVELLARFEKAVAGNAGRTLLLSPEGFLLTSALPDKGQGLVFKPTSPNFSAYRPLIWARINQAEAGQFEDTEGLWTFNTVFLDRNDAALTANAWKIVALLPAKKLYGNPELFNTFLSALLVLLVLQAVGCWKLADVCQGRKRIQEQLRDSDEQLQNLIVARTSEWVGDALSREKTARQLKLLDTALKAAAQAIVIVDSQAVIRWANPAFSALTGFALEDVLGKPSKELIRLGAQSETFYLALANSILNQRVWRGEIINKHRDGIFYNESLTISPIRHRESGNTHFIALIENISERKQAEKRLANLNRVYAMTCEIMKLIRHARDSNALCDAACRIAVQEGGFAMAWLGVPDAAGEMLHPAAFAGIDKETLAQFNRLPTSPEQNSHPAHAAYAQMCNVGSNDIESDPRTKDWRHKALALGYRSMLSLPVKTKGKVLGVYSLYAGATEVFTNREIKLLDDLANEIGLALNAIDGGAEQYRAAAEA